MSTAPSSREQLIERLNRAIQRSGNITILFTNALASRVGLSATEFECLSLLKEGPLPAGRLAELCGLTTGAVTGLIDRLEKAGLAQRSADPNDRRRVMVSKAYDAAFENRIIELYQPMGQVFHDLTDRYSMDDLAAVLDFTERSSSLVEEMIIQFHKEGKQSALTES